MMGHHGSEEKPILANPPTPSPSPHPFAKGWHRGLSHRPSCAVVPADDDGLRAPLVRARGLDPLSIQGSSVQGLRLRCVVTESGSGPELEVILRRVSLARPPF